MERGDGGFEDVVAEVVAYRRLFFEAWEQGAEDSDDGDDRARVTHTKGGVAEEENRLEHGWGGEDEVAHWWAVCVLANVFILAGKLCDHVSSDTHLTEDTR